MLSMRRCWIGFVRSWFVAVGFTRTSADKQDDGEPSKPRLQNAQCNNKCGEKRRGRQFIRPVHVAAVNEHEAVSSHITQTRTFFQPSSRSSSSSSSSSQANESAPLDGRSADTPIPTHACASKTNVNSFCIAKKQPECHYSVRLLTGPRTDGASKRTSKGSASGKGGGGGGGGGGGFVSTGDRCSAVVPLKR